MSDSPIIAELGRYSLDKLLISKVIFTLLLIPGCTTKPTLPDRPVAFEIAGKIGVRDASQGYSAQFNWRQYMDGYDIEVWGPLGQGRTRLHGAGPQMQVWQGDEMLGVGSPEDVMRANLGWSMPVEVLPFWMQGRPHVALPVSDETLDEQQRYLSFTQAGWQVALSRYDDEGGVHPGRVVALQADRKVTVIVRAYSE